MKNYKKIIAGSILSVLIISTPGLALAKEKNENGNSNNSNKPMKVEEREQNKVETKTEKSSKTNWFSSWFNSKSSKNATIAPVISNVGVTSNKARKATIKWDTDLRSNSIIWYSTTPQIDTTKNPTIKRNDRVLKHKIEINKLQPNTQYYVVVGSANNIGVTKSAEMTFTTPATNVVNDKPIVTSITGTTSVKIGEQATVTISATDPQNKTLTYGVDWADGNTVAQTAFSGTITLNHTYSKLGTYIAKFTIVNSDSKQVVYPMKIVVTTATVTDTTAPVISDIATNISGSTVLITWKTDEPATSNVFYSTNTPVDVNGTLTPKVTDSAMVTNHSLSIPSLASSTLYHFIIKSVDSLNNVALSSDATFTTN